jgi:16S rRNA (guanine527-N7)-methyltransferase
MAELASSERAALEATLVEGQRQGYVGPGPIAPHLDHALRYATATSAPAGAALDLGSGGGLPGLVLAVAWPDSTWVLLDAAARRIEFLGEAVDRLRLGPRVQVLHARAEDVGHDPAWRGRFGLVVSRSFGPPPVVAECAAPFLQVGGWLIVSEPPDAPERWPAAGLARVGLARVSPAGTVAGLARFCQVERCPARFPRRPAAQKKRPLF